jgi:hypothetical protein
LRAAVLAGNHEKAERAVAQYAESVKKYWMVLPPAERAVSPLPRQSIELLTWAREMTLMQQAMAAEHLSMAERASRSLTARARYLQLSALDSAR